VKLFGDYISRQLFTVVFVLKDNFFYTYLKKRSSLGKSDSSVFKLCIEIQMKETCSIDLETCGLVIHGRSSFFCEM